MKSTDSSRGDLTTGVIWKKLTLFALPLLLSTIIQQLYNTVDLIFAGNFIDSDAAAAIGASGILATCLVGFFGGLSMGSGVVIARFFGQKNPARISSAIHNTVALCAVGGIVLMLLGEVLVPLYLAVMRTPERILSAANGYLRIYFLSMPAIIFYNLCSGILRSLGNSKFTLYAQTIGGLANVLFDWLFIRIFQDGVNGVAWATFVSQSISALVVLARITRLDPAYALRLSKLRFDREILLETMRIGVPAGFQSMVITLSNGVAQYHINALGADAIAAFAAYFKVELIIYQPIVMMGQAVMTFAGQNYGAEKYARVRRGTRTGLLIALGATVCTSAIGLVFGRQLFRVFFGDIGAIELGLEVIRVTFPFYFLYCFLQVLGDCMRGTGESKMPMLIVLLNICLIRTALLFLIVPRVRSIQGVAICYPITWALTSGGMILYYARYRKMKLMEGQD